MQQNCAFVMSSQTFDSQRYLETQLDNDSQEFVIPVTDDSPVDKPDDKPVLAGVGGIRGVPHNAHEEEVAKGTKDSLATSVAPRAPPDWLQQYLGPRKADSWTDMPRKFRGVMNHMCKPAA